MRLRLLPYKLFENKQKLTYVLRLLINMNGNSKKKLKFVTFFDNPLVYRTFSLERRRRIVLRLRLCNTVYWRNHRKKKKAPWIYKQL
jgi:hypothetical protein